MQCPYNSARTSAEPLVIDPMVRDLDGETSRLKAAGPVVRVEFLGVPAWSVTQHAVARELLMDHRLVKDMNAWRLWTEGTVTRDWPLINMIDAGRSLFTVDGPEHRRLRLKVTQALNPRRLESIRGDVEAFTRRLLDDTEAAVRDGGAVDLKTHFAQPLPTQVISTLFDIPENKRQWIAASYQRIFHMHTPHDERLALLADLDAWYLELIAERTAAPGDDLLSDLITADDGGRRLDAEEVLGNLKALVGGGRETTISLVLSAVRGLLTHPEQLRLVLDGKVSWETVIEEVLRQDTPATHLLMRFATEDIQVGDATIPKGDGVVMSYRAICRDPRQHCADADEFDVTRETPIRHLAFGHGPHICPGAALARLEASIALPALFDRFPRLRLAVAPEQLRNLPIMPINDLESLPVFL